MTKYITMTNVINSKETEQTITCMWENIDCVYEYVKRTMLLYPSATIKVLDIEYKEWTVYKAGRIVDCDMGVVI